MTTIVANLECMAADQRATDDGPPLCHVEKIRRIGDSLFGVAGDCFAALAILEWLEAPRRDRAKLYKMFGDEPGWRYEVMLLELSPSGLALWNGWGLRMPLLDAAYAVGTGGAVALDALENGAAPDEAIRRAMKRDQFSGLFKEPQIEYLLPPELKPKRRR